MPVALPDLTHPDDRLSAVPPPRPADGFDVPLRTVRLGPGATDPGALDGAGLLLVCDGLLLVEARLHRTWATEINGPGDLVCLEPRRREALTADVRLRAPGRVRVAVLDGRLDELLRRSPAVAERLLAGAGERTRRQLVHRAACQMPRVEDRLLAVLWLLADRWGTLRDGVVELPFDLHHALLGRLVGAARPTVTMAVGALSDQGHIGRPAAGRLTLSPASRQQFGGAATEGAA